jgi:hypothetical protein
LITAHLFSQNNYGGCTSHFAIGCPTSFFLSR